MRAQKQQEERPTIEPASKKRKASPDQEDEGTIHKRSKPGNGIPEGFFDTGHEDRSPVIPHGVEMQIPSRPATPSKPTEPPLPSKPEPQVDEDEWAAFENDIATAEAQSKADNDAVISAPAVSAADLAKKSAEEEYATKKDRQEAEIQGEKEDAARKMEDELETMEGFEARVKRLREKREALRRNEGTKVEAVVPVTVEIPEEEDDDEDEDYDDGWDNFRMK